VRYLFVTFDGGGNLVPELALAGRLRDRGHQLRFLGHRSQRAAVEQAGIAFSSYERAPDQDTTRPETSIQDWAVGSVEEMAALIRDTVAFGPAHLFAADLEAELDRHPVDALAVDYWLFGALAAAEKSGLPTAVLRHTGYAPGAWWNEGLPELNALRARLGLPPVSDVFEQYLRMDREMVLTSRAFDFAITETALPANALHVGPQIAMPQEVNGRPGGGDQRPLVLVSFSTTYQAQEAPLARVIDALGGLAVRTLLTTGPAIRLDADLPANVEVRDWIPHGDVLPHAALVITHAGLGTVMAALAHGVPLLCLPMGRDQDGNAARVAHLGAGSVLPTDAGAAQIARAVSAALTDPVMKSNARRLGATIRAELAADQATIALEALTTTPNTTKETAMTTAAPTTGSARVQSKLWGARARDWAELQENQVTQLYQTVLAQLGVKEGTRLLDAGCGAGLAAQIASRRGAVVSGLDATPELLEIARERVPDAEFTTGDLEALPYPDHTFDAVAGFNSFQYATNPQIALRQARRVAKPGAPVAIVTWAVAERCEAAAYLAALKPLLPPAPPDAPGPFALSAPGALEQLATAVGLQPSAADEVACHWTYPDRATMLRALLSAGPAVKAIETSGETAVRAAIETATAPFRDQSGAYSIGSAFRYLIAIA
jgi:MGT family glycosyltransferase